MKTHFSNSLARYLTATMGLAISSLTVWLLVSHLAFSQDNVRRSGEAKALPLVQVLREEGPQNAGKKYNATAIRYSYGSETTYGIVFAQDFGDKFEMSLATATAFREVFQRFSTAERPRETLVKGTMLSLSYTTLKGNPGSFEWSIQNSEKGHKTDQAEAKDIVNQIDKALTDVEAMKAVKPCYAVPK